MKKTLLIASHIGSGSDILFDILNENPRVMGYRTGEPYISYNSFMKLSAVRHKTNNSAAIWMDELLHNHTLQIKDAYRWSKFVYLVAPPRVSMGKIFQIYGKTASRYYGYRLRRICEMAKRTPGAVLLTWEDVRTGRGLPFVEQYLGLRDSLRNRPELFEKFEEANLPYESMAAAEDSYSRHLSFLYRQNLVFWQ